VAQRQYSGNVHGVVTGIGLVNLVHGSGESSDFLPLDLRVYTPGQEGLTKNDHFQALLFDSW